MSHETKVALERIAALCSTSNSLPDRLVRVYDVALQGLGLTAGQRKVEIQAAIQRKRDRLAAREQQQGVTDGPD